MTLRSLAMYGQLLRRFRNGWQLVRAIRGGPPCYSGVLWDGTRIDNPPGRTGLVEVLVELWLEQPYTRGGFYRPADGDVVVDAGANVGVFSIWLARRHPRCRVVALEPFPENFACLEANLRSARLGAGRVEPQRLALGPTFGQGRMIAVGGRSLDHRLAQGGEAREGWDVATVPLEGLFDLAQTDRISLLKVDIEGSERDAFEHADPAVLGRIDRVAIEYHDHIRPGTLALLRSHLEPTHHCVVRPSAVEGCGILLASRKADGSTTRGICSAGRPAEAVAS
jgi:FkbM family methyltransferase